MIDSIIIGLSGVIFALVVINIIIPMEKRITINNTRTYLIIFLIGIIVNTIAESIDLTNIYNMKHFQTTIKMLSMQ